MCLSVKEVISHAPWGINLGQTGLAQTQFEQRQQSHGLGFEYGGIGGGIPGVDRVGLMWS